MVRTVRSSSMRLLVRKAFTMIELIYAIVVIAVVTLTIPMMIQVNNKGFEGNLAGEAIFIISSVLSEATTLVWDNSSLPGGSAATDVILSKILDVPTGDAAYVRSDINTTIRTGGLDEDMHRQFFNTTTVPVQVAGIVALPNTFNNTGARLKYKRVYTVNVTSRYIDDTPNSPFEFSKISFASQTNIKMTEVKITAEIDSVPTVISVLRAYTCNIGEIDYAKRRF